MHKLYSWSQTFWGDLICCFIIAVAGWILFYALMWLLWIVGVMP